MEEDKGDQFNIYGLVLLHPKDWHDKENRASVGLPPANKPLKISQMGKNFLISPTPERIIKLNKENITDQETIERLLTDKEVLKEFNIELNY